MTSDGPDKNDRRIERLQKENQRLKAKLDTLKKEKAADKRAFNRIRKAFNDMPGGLALVQDGKIRLINQEALHRMGYSEKEVLNRSFLDFVHPDAIRQVSTYNKNRISGKAAPERYETSMLTKTGEKTFCEVRAKKIRYNNRRAVALNLLDMDEKRIEDKRATELFKIEIAGQMAEGVCSRLDDCLHDLDRLYEGIGRYQSLSGLDMEQLRAYIEKSRMKGIRLRDLMKTLTVDEDESPGNSFFDIRITADKALAKVRPPRDYAVEETDPRIIDIKTCFESSALVQGNAAAVQEALTEILSNAFEALPDGGEVHITTEVHGGFVFIYIQDSGPGIPEVIKDRIFDPFFTTKETAGSGLGLSMARAVVRRHRGDIELISRKGQGSTFIIKLPVSEHVPTAQKINGNKSLKDSRALVIMEDELTSDLLLRFMESRGMHVKSMPDIKEAVKALSKGHFDLVVSDGLAMDSASLRAAARKKSNDPPPHVVIIENRTGPGGIARGSPAGADLIIRTPLRMDEVMPLLGNLIQQNRT